MWHWQLPLSAYSTTWMANGVVNIKILLQSCVHALHVTVHMSELSVLRTAMSRSSTIGERLSSPMLSQGRSSTSSRADRTTSDLRPSLRLSYTHADQSQQREELSLIRTIADVHCLLAEVRSVDSKVVIMTSCHFLSSVLCIS